MMWTSGFFNFVSNECFAHSIIHASHFYTIFSDRVNSLEDMMQLLRKHRADFQRTKAAVGDKERTYNINQRGINPHCSVSMSLDSRYPAVFFVQWKKTKKQLKPGNDRHIDYLFNEVWTILKLYDPVFNSEKKLICFELGMPPLTFFFLLINSVMHPLDTFTIYPLLSFAIKN